MSTALYKPPTGFQELQFVANIYKNRDELEKTFLKNGYSLYSNISVPTVECVFYVPSAFPQDRHQVTPQPLQPPFSLCIGNRIRLFCVLWQEDVHWSLYRRDAFDERLGREVETRRPRGFEIEP